MASQSLQMSARTLLRRPRITEKSSNLSGMGVYCFEVATGAQKADINNAIKEVYGVTPLRVHISKLPGKRLIYRGVPGKKPGIKKAYVYLKKGEKINFV